MRPRSRQPAVGDLDFDAMQSIQLMVGELSHRVPSAACFTLGALVRATPTASTSAASSKSEFVRQPRGLSIEITLENMSPGNASHCTNGAISLLNENQAPPAPSAAAS